MEKLPEKMVRAEWAIPPTRMVCSSWYEDFENVTDDEYRAAVLEEHPRATGIKIKRGITPNAAHAISFHDTDEESST
jgi:hypothetical protein